MEETERIGKSYGMVLVKALFAEVLAFELHKGLYSAFVNFWTWLDGVFSNILGHILGNLSG